MSPFIYLGQSAQGFIGAAIAKLLTNWLQFQFQFRTSKLFASNVKLSGCPRLIGKVKND